MSTELLLERVLPLPPADIWRAWKEPALLMRWFCPAPWQTVECEIDMRPGGAFRAVLQGPDGERVTHVGCVLEADAPSRLVWTTALLPGFVPAAESTGVPAFTAVLTFEAVETGTHYKVRALHRDTDAAQAHATMGFHEGWGAALSQLVGAVKGHVAEG